MKTWYVELESSVYHTQQVLADSADEAERLVRAGLNYPQDWKTITVEEAAVDGATNTPAGGGSKIL